MSAGSDYPPGTEISYGEFGRALFASVLHEDRIADAVALVLGDTIALGPFGAGPGRMARVTALGTIGRPRVTRLPGDFVTFDVMLPVQVAFDLDIAVGVHTFNATMEVPLRLEARAAAPLTIVLAISPPREEDLVVRTEVDRRRTAMLKKVAGIDDELRRFMVRYVARELTKEHVVRATRLDLAEILDHAWPMISEEFLRPPEVEPMSSL